MSIEEITPVPPAGFKRCQLAIRFLVANHTSSDVAIKRDSELLNKASDSGALDLANTGLTISGDVFIPTRQSAVLRVITVDRCEKHTGNWDACLKEDFKGIRALVIFVKEGRYEIDLPLN